MKSGCCFFTFVIWWSVVVACSLQPGCTCALGAGRSSSCSPAPERTRLSPPNQSAPLAGTSADQCDKHLQTQTSALWLPFIITENTLSSPGALTDLCWLITQHQHFWGSGRWLLPPWSSALFLAPLFPFCSSPGLLFHASSLFPPWEKYILEIIQNVTHASKRTTHLNTYKCFVHVFTDVCNDACTVALSEDGVQWVFLYGLQQSGRVTQPQDFSLALG